MGLGHDPEYPDGIFHVHLAVKAQFGYEVETTIEPCPPLGGKCPLSGTGLQKSRSGSAEDFTLYLPKMLKFTKWVNSDLLKNFSVPNVAQKHDWHESQV
jgi:hypothetical protein